MSNVTYGTRKRTLCASIAMLVAALLVLTAPAVLIQTVTEQSSVSVKLKSDPTRTLEATIKASGIPAKERITIVVDMLERSAQDNKLYSVDDHQLYRAHLGPGPTGSVEFALEVPIPLSQYHWVGIKSYLGDQAPKECYVTGCTVVWLPPRSAEPQLSPSWETVSTWDPKRPPILAVQLRAQNVLRSPSTEKILLRVHARTASDARFDSRLYSSVVTANSKGLIEPELVKIPVPKRFKEVCVTATAAMTELVEQSSLDKVCPAKDFKGVWSSLSNPASS
jgi:hypothetical protein